jgi:flagellar biosynthesis anti-sigma factor FlgM
MKGITGNPVLDAYQRMDVSKVGAAKPVERTEAGGPDVAPSTPAVEVSISARARDLALENPEPVSNPEKVQSLKTQIADGHYHVDSKLVAERMLESLA